MSAAPGFYNELIFLHVHVLHFSCKYGFCVCIYELIIQAVLVTAYLSRCYQPVYYTCTCMCLIRLTVILTGNLNFTTYWFLFCAHRYLFGLQIKRDLLSGRWLFIHLFFLFLFFPFFRILRKVLLVRVYCAPTNFSSSYLGINFSNNIFIPPF